MAEILLSETVGAVRTLTLNRPDRLNSLSNPLLAGLEAAFAEAEDDNEVRVLLLTGCGRAFSTGGIWIRILRACRTWVRLSRLITIRW